MRTDISTLRPEVLRNVHVQVIRKLGTARPNIYWDDFVLHWEVEDSLSGRLLGKPFVIHPGALQSWSELATQSSCPDPVKYLADKLVGYIFYVSRTHDAFGPGVV